MAGARPIAGIAALAAIAGLLWAVAPALSLTRFAPEPVNFEQRVPATVELDGREARRSSVRHLTEPFAAPKRFDLVGLVDHEDPVELRTRSRGGSWSPWVETSRGEPVWTGGADELQLRSRGSAPRGEIGYVNVSGDAGAAEARLNGLRAAVNSAFLSVAALAAPAPAGADPPFEVVNRTEWDPEERCVPKTPVHGEVRAAVVHHTVNSNTYTAEEGPGIVLAICRYHRYSHGWNDIGYNALVDRFGNIYAGRSGGLSEPVVGAHTGGFNSQTVGVSSIGTHTTTGMSKAALGAVIRFLTWKLPLHGIDAAGKATLLSAGGSGNRYRSGERAHVPEVTRHRRLNETACPGKAQVEKIQRRTARRIAARGYEDGEPPPDDGGIVVITE